MVNHESYEKPTIEVDGKEITQNLAIVFVVFAIWSAVAIDWAAVFTAAVGVSVAMTAAAVLHVGAGEDCPYWRIK